MSMAQAQVAGYMILCIGLVAWFSWILLKPCIETKSPLVLATGYSWQDFMADIDSGVEIDVIFEKCKRFGMPRRPVPLIWVNPCVVSSTTHYEWKCDTGNTSHFSGINSTGTISVTTTNGGSHA